MRIYVTSAVTVLLALFLVERDANAELTIAADGQIAVTTVPRVVQTGAGFGGRIGYRLKLPLISITPEIGVTYHVFGGDPTGTDIVRGFGGGRVAIGEILKPSVFAHFGYGNASGNVSYAGPTYDVGAALDFTALPVFDVGIHADYAQVTSAPTGVTAASWIDLGAHFAIYF